MEEEVAKINEIIDAYFAANPKVNTTKPKELMPACISAGLFVKDVKAGKPLREILRKLKKEEKLHLIPSLRTEETEKSIYWYFDRK